MVTARDKCEERKMKYVQVSLQRENMMKYAWIPKKKGVKLGCKVELKTDGNLWEVIGMHGEEDELVIKKQWDMSRVFGESLRPEEKVM